MKVFIDTAPFIYILDGQSNFTTRTVEIFTDYLDQGHMLYTSVLTLMGVKPERNNRPEVITKFFQFLTELDVEILDVNDSIAITAYRLRARYKFQKSMDALQLVSAIRKECDLFLTNYKKLKRITEIETQLITNHS